MELVDMPTTLIALPVILAYNSVCTKQTVQQYYALPSRITAYHTAIPYELYEYYPFTRNRLLICFAWLAASTRSGSTLAPSASTASFCWRSSAPMALA